MSGDPGRLSSAPLTLPVGVSIQNGGVQRDHSPVIG